LRGRPYLGRVGITRAGVGIDRAEAEEKEEEAEIGAVGEGGTAPVMVACSVAHGFVLRSLVGVDGLGVLAEVVEAGELL
jgi:stage V sporulation protein SpoVS